MIVVDIIGQGGAWKSLFGFSTWIKTLSVIWIFNATEKGREYSARVCLPTNSRTSLVGQWHRVGCSIIICNFCHLGNVSETMFNVGQKKVDLNGLETKLHLLLLKSECLVGNQDGIMKLGFPLMALLGFNICKCVYLDKKNECDK